LILQDDGESVWRDPQLGSKLENELGKKKNITRIGFLNCGGIRGKAREIEEWMDREEIDVLGCAETWLRLDDNTDLNVLIRKDDSSVREFDTMGRPCRGKRGMMVIKNKKTKEIKWENVETNVSEFIHIILETINIMYIYFPPKETKEYVNKLSLYITNLQLGTKNKIIILGDFNINSMQSESKGNNYGELEEMMAKNGIYRNRFLNEGKGTGTFIYLNGMSIIDQIWSNTLKRVSRISETATISDHEGVMIDMDEHNNESNAYKESVRKIYRPSINQENKECLKKQFNEILNTLTREIDITDIEVLYQTLNGKIVEAFEMVYKAKDIKKWDKVYKLVLTPQIKFWMKVRQRMKRNLRDQKDYEELFKVSKEIRKAIRTIKCNNWLKYDNNLKSITHTQALKLYSRSSKREPIYMAPTIEIEKQVNEIFPFHKKRTEIIGTYFKRKCQRKNKLLDKSENIIEATDLVEVRNILNSTRNSSAPGLTGITYEIYKLMDDANLNKWVNIFNRCLAECVSMQGWCTAMTIAIPKKDGGIRPITLLETSRKMFEKIIFNRLIKQVKISPRQCGFMANKDTSIQIVNIEATIRKMHCNQLSICFLDVKKAYDTVDRATLFKKLNKNNQGAVQKSIVKLLELLFNYCHTKLIMGGKISKEIWLERGLVQGSKLSPILYNIFINDLPEKIESITKTINTICFLYADDIAVISKTKLGMIKALKQGDKYSKENKFEFNVKKCASMSKSKFEFKLGKQIINNVESFEYLGMEISRNGIIIKNQIQKNINRARKKWFRIERAGLLQTNSLSTETKILILKSIIIPTIEYGLEFSLIKENYVKKTQSIVSAYIRRILKLTKNSKIKNLCWLANIELRKSAFERKLSKLKKKIMTDNEYTYNIMMEQAELGRDKKSKILGKISQDIEITKKENNIDNMMGGIKRPKQLLNKIMGIKDGIFLLKYIASDFKKVVDNKMVTIKFENISVRRAIRQINKGNCSLAKNIKDLLISGSMTS
jgi:hypothetical protein